MKIPDGYQIFDWLGDHDYIQWISDTRKLPGKRWCDAKFKEFEPRIAIGVSQLQLWLSQEGVFFDRSYESLIYVDQWLLKFFRDYDSEYREEMLQRAIPEIPRVGKAITETTPLLRSLIGDCYIYYFEVLNARFGDVRWSVCYGQFRDGTWLGCGSPELESKFFGKEDGGLMYYLRNVVDYYRGHPPIWVGFSGAFEYFQQRARE